MLRGVGVGAGEQDHPVGVLGAGGPDLLAVDDVVVAVADGAGLEGGEVGAGAGLAEALAPDGLARRACRAGMLLLLLLGAVGDDGGAGHADADAAGPRGAGEGISSLKMNCSMTDMPAPPYSVRRGRRPPAEAAHPPLPGLI